MNLLQLFEKVSTFIFDMDGVLTDGNVLVLANGVQARRMSIRDGFALQLAVRSGYRVMVVSGGHSPEARGRLEKLGVNDIHMSIEDKRSFINDYIAEKRLKKEEVLFMGDDLPDLPVMEIVGVPCCPSDAAPELQEAVQYISPRKGGDACVRDVIEKVLRLHHKWHYLPGVQSQ
jgi:3-deoxy-D-manno-octulosonate 8-phosphate phosphatase (KDO 8-P phosphatase)